MTRKEPPMPEYAPPRNPYLTLILGLCKTGWILCRIAMKLVAICFAFIVAFVVALTWGK